MTTTTMMTTTDTELTREPSVPAAHEPVGAGRSRGQRALQLWIAGGCVAVLAAFVFVAVAIPLPYTTQDPGSATQVGPLMSVKAGTVPFFPPKSSVAFTTVSQREATFFDLLRGWIDDDVDVYSNDFLYGGSSRTETRFVNAGLMNASKVKATTVALRRLGYDVAVRTNGTIVRQIGPSSPAAGVLQLDDIITKVDGEPVDLFGEIRDLLQAGGPGATHVLTVERPPASGTFVEVPITTVAAEGEPDRAIVGITPEERLGSVDLPFTVDIDERRVGGPSAGLAFALGIIDVLTEGELTGGHKVAITGTIDFDGTVGPVGGAKQKSAAVRNAGYEAFLVPPAEADEVRAAIGDDVTVISVSTLQEALDALASLGGDLSPLGPAGAAPAPR
jgi:PDZ domain-containing protein